MDTVIASFNSGQGLGSLIQYACIGANVMFLSSALITSFTSFLIGPFYHFDSQPIWMFTSFCSFAVACFNITIVGTISSRFRTIADSVPEPGYEDKQALNLKTAFYLSTILGGIFASATAFLAFLWGRAAFESIPFIVPCIFGVLAVLIDVAAIYDNFKRFREETRQLLSWDD
ncbi:uncharacterized protein A1O5_01179 [Cladophialophora psammophila CBS 110553]|uniref:Uncharacterized protein n=1 Tax=Cladophialophora psammophila CBS 110553 TaxID=1182543 RepID=W9XI85_9EURO|nr:uncharacterized protein A1O5_01179 [Cladophialophora psammophila CBS 110553]EXJ76671.1 hypothetical protein A1O5_01179 [Cladophialophora psammophila CBS 110553]